MGLPAWLNPVGEVLKGVGAVAKDVGDRFWPKKMTELEKMTHYAQIFAISEASTDSARKMFMTEMQTQKQPWVIRWLNGLVRPVGGLGALFTEFYVIWGSNVAEWTGTTYIPVELSMEQHVFLLSIVAFYFGSRLKETLSGVTTRR